MTIVHGKLEPSGTLPGAAWSGERKGGGRSRQEWPIVQSGEKAKAGVEIPLEHEQRNGRQLFGDVKARKHIF